MSSAVDLQLAVDWLYYAMKIDLGISVGDYDRAVDLAVDFAELSNVVPIYRFTRATNQPRLKNGMLAESQIFVTCDKRDMQPYRCDSILANDFQDAYAWAIYHAIRYGESYALINGESFDFSELA